MVDVTLLEVHLDGANLTANTPFGGPSTPESADRTESTSGEGSSPLLAAVVGLVFLVVLAFLARRKLHSAAHMGHDASDE